MSKFEETKKNVSVKERGLKRQKILTHNGGREGGRTRVTHYRPDRREETSSGLERSQTLCVLCVCVCVGVLQCICLQGQEMIEKEKGRREGGREGEREREREREKQTL